MTFSARALASSRTVGGTPWALKTSTAPNTCRKSAKAFLVAGKLYRFRAIYSVFPPHAFLRFRAQGANSRALRRPALLASQKHNLNQAEHLKSPRPQSFGG